MGCFIKLQILVLRSKEQERQGGLEPTDEGVSSYDEVVREAQRRISTIIKPWSKV